MIWIIIIITGAIIGWIASLIMETDAQQGFILNVIVGIVGALLGQWLFGTVLKIGSAFAAGSFSLWGIVWGVIGAIILISFLKVLHVLK